MSSTLTLGFAALVRSLYLWWGFRVLPDERWQIFATVPAEKNGQGAGWVSTLSGMVS
jgi:hypothetical protein